MTESCQAHWMRLEALAFGKEFLPMNLPHLGTRRGPAGSLEPYQQPAALRDDGWVNPDLPEFPPPVDQSDWVLTKPRHLGGHLRPPPNTPLIESRDEEIARWNRRNAELAARPIEQSRHVCSWECAALRCHLIR